MADQKPPEVNTCTVADCRPIQPADHRWFEAHMPCWVCVADNPDKRGELMWNSHCEAYFHRSCIESAGRG